MQFRPWRSTDGDRRRFLPIATGENLIDFRGGRRSSLAPGKAVEHDVVMVTGGVIVEPEHVPHLML